MKCLNCGLVNFKNAQQCSRCQSILTEHQSFSNFRPEPIPIENESSSIYRYVAIGFILIAVIVGFKLFSIKNEYTEKAKSYEMKEPSNFVDLCKTERIGCETPNPSNTPLSAADYDKRYKMFKEEQNKRFKEDEEFKKWLKQREYQPPPPGTVYYEKR